MEQYICPCCGKAMKLENMHVTHYFFKMEIQIQNVPQLVCDSCGNTEYKNESKVWDLLRDAYLNKKDIVEFA